MNKKYLVALITAVITMPTWSLDILLSNDDGCSAEGIQALKSTLVNAGHTVSLYAPAGEQSGKSGSIETKIHFSTYSENSFIVNNSPYKIANPLYHPEYNPGVVPVITPVIAAQDHCVRVERSHNLVEGSAFTADKYVKVSATPRDSLLVGLASLNHKPDLVISGINNGQNIGIMSTASGTVNVAVTALQQGIPSIAVSNYTNNPLSALKPALSYSEVSHFIVDLVNQLEAKRLPGRPLLPSYTGLNINFPSGQVSGVANTVLGKQSDIFIGPRNIDGKIRPSYISKTLADVSDSEAANNSIEALRAAGVDIHDETSMYLAGYITISAIDGDYGAGFRKRKLMKLKLRDLEFEDQ